MVKLEFLVLGNCIYILLKYLVMYDRYYKLMEFYLSYEVDLFGVCIWFLK